MQWGSLRSRTPKRRPIKKALKRAIKNNGKRDEPPKEKMANNSVYADCEHQQRKRTPARTAPERSLAAEKFSTSFFTKDKGRFF